MKSKFSLFKTQRFLPLFATQFFGAFNDNLLKSALLVLITYGGFLANEKSIGLAINLASALFILPFFLFSASAGKLADKYDKALLVRWIKSIELLLMCLSYYFFITQNLFGLFTLLFCMGLQSSFFGPIKYSLLPIQLHKDELVRGNGFFEAGTFLAILLGTIMGTIIYQSHPQYGPTSVAIILIIFSSIGLYTSFKIPLTHQTDAKIKLSFNFILDTIELIKDIKKKTTIWLIILGISWFFLIGTAFLSQFPSYTQQLIRGNEYILMLFLTLFSIGVGLGSVAYQSFSKGNVKLNLVRYSVIGMSASILLFTICSHYYKGYIGHNTSHELYGITDFLNTTSWAYGICFSLFALATFSGLYIVPLYTLLQQYADQKKLAQTIACNNIINSFFMALINLIIIALITINISLGAIFLSIAIINLAIIYLINMINKLVHQA